MSKIERQSLLANILLIGGILMGGFGFTEKLPWRFNEIFLYLSLPATIIGIIVMIDNIKKL